MLLLRCTSLVWVFVLFFFDFSGDRELFLLLDSLFGCSVNFSIKYGCELLLLFSSFLPDKIIFCLVLLHYALTIPTVFVIGHSEDIP